MNNPEQERAEFEAWLNPEYSRELDGMDCYIDGTVYSMFSAWQAARRAQVVPDAVTPAMVDAAEEAYMPFGDMEIAIACALAAAPRPPKG